MSVTLTPSRRKNIAGAALATSVALAMLISLGVWQLQRLRWKQGIIAQIDAAETLPPIQLGAGTPPLFTRVIVEGTLRSAQVALYGAEVQSERLGARLVEVLDRPGLPPLLVVLGWVPTEHVPVRPVSGTVKITGYVRLPETPGWLAAQDDPQSRRFYTLNPAAIGASLGAPAVAPFTLVALGKPPSGVFGAPVPAEFLPRPVNNHLQYALTWFGLGAALLGVFLAWALSPAKADP